MVKEKKKTIMRSEERKEVENEIALLMNPDRILQLRHSSVDPANDSPNNSASPSSSSATFHPSAPAPPSSRLSLNPARLPGLCEYQLVVMTCTTRREKGSDLTETILIDRNRGLPFSQIRLLLTEKTPKKT